MRDLSWVLRCHVDTVVVTIRADNQDTTNSSLDKLSLECCGETDGTQ